MLKNLKEKLKKEITKKKIATIAIFAVAVIIAIIAIVVNQTNEQSSKRKRIIADGELARAMTYDQFAEGDDAIEGTDNVKFSAFFLRDINGDGYAEKIKGTCKQIGKEDTLYMEVNVQTDGILKNAKIEVDGKNFYLATTAPKDNELKDNYVGTNIKKLEFNDMANGTQKLITGVVRSGDYSYTSSKASAIGSNINNLSRNDNKIIFTGTYVGSDGNEVQINKEINLQTDWYGTTSASITTSSSTYYDIQDRQNEEDGTLTLTAGIRAFENNYQLNIKKNYVEGTIPQLNGYNPISVTAETSTDSFNYDEATRKFTLTRDAQVDETGNITKSISRDNIHTLKIVYPLEAYKSLDSTVVTIEIPVMTYYEGYNNTNREFTNPYKSNEAKGILTYTFRGPQEYQTSLDIKVGEYMYNPTYRYVVSKKKPIRIYNEISSEEKDDNYIVSWYISKGTNESSDGLIMKERKDGEATVADNFVKVDATRDSMESLTTNIGIGFGNADKFLGDDGYIKVYDDETDELLVTFTKDDWGKYTRTSPYKFSMPVKHIRVETSQTQDSQYFYVYSQKQLDDEYITTNYTREQFDDLKYIESHLNVYAGTKLLGTLTHMANYEAPYSIAELTLSKNTLSTQLTEKNEILTIKATANESANQVGWTNGSFLIKLPADIIATDINTVEINNSSISLTSYEYIENDNGKFIKINTKNTNNTAQTFEVRIDTNITPDPRIATTTENFELWASNEEGVDYYYNSADIYDVNDNLNLDEKVHKSTTSVSLIAPNSLLTNQTASGFDKSGTQIVSPQIADVKPQLATVSQDTPEKTVKIGAQIKNNYSSVITDVVMLGKIPFEGNTYVLSGEDLGSEFTTKMTNKGIEVPEALQGKVTVYYSENETPDKDLSNTENGWKTAENITNWDNIKTYLIDFQDVEIASGAEYTFYYTIQVPNGLDYNKKTFSHHGVYFSLKTPEGKYKTQTEPNKLGIRIAEKYNLELQKYQTGKTNLVPRATYKVTKEATDTDEEEVATAVTNAEGILELQNLYAKRTYAIEEIKVPEDYELNTDVIKIIGTVQADGSLQITKIQGTTREDIEVTKEEDEPYKVIVKVEDEAKVKLKLTKLEKDTTTHVRGIRYKLTGTGLPESGKNVTTNANGEITVKGLKVGEEYTLEETKAEGYYLASPIKFTVTNTDGTYEINVSEGTVKESSITEEENIPTANIQVEDEKIPTYNLEISKIQRITSTAVTEDELRAKAKQALSSTDTVYLSGAKFRLYKGTKELGSYITDENGKITLNDLYQYIDGKDEEATYTLKETLSPEGYSKVKDITFKVDGSTGELKFINAEGKDESYTLDGNTVKLLVEDNPSFKLIKKDSETDELLANIKFAIYNIDNDTTTPAKNSKGETIGTKETINGREYYTVTTDSKGEITADLPEGMYKAVEVEAPEKYDLSDSTYYFGIGTSREGKEGVKATWAQGIGGTDDDEINSVATTSDGGYIVGGYFESSIDLENGVILTNKRYEDGMIIKYNANGEVEWGKAIGGAGIDEINSVAETTDGSYIIVGDFYSKSIDLEGEVKLINKGNKNGMIIKYNSEGTVEWAKGIGGTSSDEITSVAETLDGGYIVGGVFQSSSIDLGNGINLSSKGSSNGMIIKYGSGGEVEWAKGIGGTVYDEIIAETSDGGCIVGGVFQSSSIDLGNGASLTNKGTCNGMIIKYSSSGEVEWAQGIGETVYDGITSIAETSDGGYIVGGYFQSSSIDLGNGASLTNNSKSTGYSDGMIIKYSRSGEVEWAKSIGGRDNDRITSVAECSDGGYIAGGYFYSSSIELGNEMSLSSKGSSDGMIIKYNANGEIEWAKGIGGTDDFITSIAETSGGTYIVGGYFYSSSIDLENEISLSSKGSSDGMVIKFEKAELPNPKVIQAQGIGGLDSDNISSVSKTRDGGYIVGGYFQSSSIDLGNGVSLNNKGYSDGMIIKYSASGKVKWTQGIGGTGNDFINSISETRDGGCIVGGAFQGSSIDLGNGISLNSKDSRDGMIIKYSGKGETEWARGIGGSDYDYIKTVAETSDGGYIIGGNFESNSIDLGNGISLNNKGSSDGMIIKYSANGEVEWAEGIGGSGNDQINTVASTSDGGYIVGGYFESSSIDLGNGISLTNKGYRDGMIIKYNAAGEVEWAKEIGGIYSDRINTVIGTKDGGSLVGGDFSDAIDLGNEVNLNSNGNSDGMIIKYSSSGEVEWAKEIGGRANDCIKAVTETNDGSYIVIGELYSDGITFENGICITNTGNSHGMIIKYNNNGEINWAKAIPMRGSETIDSVIDLENNDYIIVGYFYSRNIDMGNGVNLINQGRNGGSDGMILKITTQMGVPEVQELEVDNKRKEFKITTDVKEIDNIKGGSISGEDENPYEKVKYGDTSTNEIKMIPDENYEIIGITVNGKDYSFTANEDGNYTMPAFTNMTEDKHIVVTYSLKDNKITINKIDKNTKEKLSGATFKLDQIEERSEPNNSEIIGELTDNGQEYIEIASLEDEVSDKFGEITNNGTYYFVQNDDGTYTPTNSKKYQTANGGSAGISGSTANSYIPIDLTDLTGQYAVVVNANCSSETNCDIGYATITENTTAPGYSSSTGRFMYVSGTSDTKDYMSTILNGGKTYYLHLGYRKDSSADTGTDQIVINSIKLYNASTNTVTYNFTNNDGKYESTNAGKDDTVSNSYIPIDLTNYTGKYNLTVNAEVSSQSSDYGYVTVTENTTRQSYNSSTGRFVYISGTQSAKDYTTVLQGGKMYYLHLGYYKNASDSSGDDKFTVNSINVTLNDSELYHTTIETNSDGQAITQIPFGKYSITETKAPDGYWLNETPTIVEFRSTDGAIHEFTIEDEAKAKLTVHHYIKETTTKLAEDEKSEAHIGDSYTTNPKLDLDKYELETDENGKLILPENATGTYAQTPTEVTYYYVEKKIPLTVHHYIEGTTTQVPLKTGGTAGDQVDSGLEGENYTTSAISDENLSDEYELAEVPANANGIYTGDEVIVTYYYKKVSREVNLVKYQQDGTTPLQGAKFTVRNKNETEKDMILAQVIKENGTYYFENKGEKYISNNQGKSSTTANSYIKIDMTNASEDATVTVNAEISSESGCDIGYATMTENTTAPSYSSTIGRFIYISGTQSAKDYTTNLEKGKIYYLHLGYRKDGSRDTGTDTFTINSIKINNIDYSEYSKTYTTNEQGKIQTNLEAGTYEITETEAPEGYKLPENPTTEITITKATTSEDIAITNEKKTGTVTVHHYIEGTTNQVPMSDGSIAEDETKTGYVGDMYATTAKEGISDSYELVSEPENSSGNYIEGNIEVIYYYRPVATSVLVHHYLEGTTTKLADDETIDGRVGDEYTTSVANVDSKYELVATPANANGNMTKDQIIVIYYYRVKDTSVLVHHYKEGTTEKVSEDVTLNGKIDEEYTTTIAEDLPEYYELVEEPTNKEGTMTEEQIVVTYYYRLKKYPYTVNYLEKGTNKVLHEAKTTEDITYGTVINTKDEVIDINGYGYDSADKESLSIAVSGNVINIYYTKITGLSYTVNYLEKDTDEVLHTPKTVDGQTFEDEITSDDEVIDIDGYNYDSVDKDKLIIGTGENVINIYYTKRNDLAYTVNYLEKDTNKVLHEQKNQTGMTFKDTVTSADEVIDIDGYDYDSVDKATLIIGTDENVINIYYTKRTDLSYKVNYLEKGTNKILHDQKVQENMTFESVVNSSNEVIDIDGYDYDSVDKETLTIGTSENVINIYYTKRNDLSYKVNYLEKDTNKVLHDQKVQDGMTFESTVTSSDEVIGIDGYNYDSVDKDTLTITTGENIINIYYTKRNDLSYKVNYLEKTTNKVLHDQKVQDGMTFESVVTSSDEVIEIDGYNYDSVDKDTLTIGTSENVINIYYTKRTDLSYEVNYLEKGTNKVLHNQKIQNGMTFESKVETKDEVIDIEGYKYDSADKDTLIITTGANIINIYYTKITGLSYTVNYLEKDTNEVINPPKIQDGMTFEDVVTSANEVIDIDGYNYDSVDKETLTIGTTENVINIYYTKRNDLSYKVNYLEKETNKVLHDQKVQENMTFESIVTSADEVIDIDGYKYDSVDKETLTITTGENVINIYYTKRNDLSYKVNYLEKDTNKVLHDQKTQDGMTFESTVKSSDEVIDIDGYNYDSVDKDTLTITTGENVINIYYTKRNDLSYKVNYLEKTTNKVLHDQKIQNGMTFESVVTSSDEVIDIDGYNYDSVDKDTLTVTTGENVINIYYTKRNDLSYTVNYLEKDTNIVLHEPKVTENMTFETEITSSKEVIDIDGYNYDSVDKDTLIIGTGENVINIYYTKRNDLSYTVNYLEKGTNRTIHAPKVTQNMTFGTEITSSKEVIAINGYSYDSVDKDSLIVTTGENIINIYYTKVSGLSYTVNYLEKDTNEVLQAPKTTGDMTFEDEITSSDEVIEIDGYNYDSVDKEKLVIGTGENVINIYYTKRNDLSYKVNYLEKDTNKVLHDQKTQDGMTFESVVTSANEVIDIDGYNYDSVDKETLTITTGENVINIYYTKRTDLSYTVNYLEKDTNNVLHEQKVQDGMTFESVVNSSDEVISIYGYNYDSVDKDTITITTGENVINIYYTKKDTKVTVHYYEEGTTNKVSEDVEIPGKVFDDYTTTSADDIPSKYELVAEPENKNGTMTEDEITVIYYYRKKATQVIVHYYEENTTKKLSEDVTINGRVDDKYTTISATDIPIKYELVATPSNANGSMTEATIEVIYYYRVKDAVVHVRYLEKGTEKVLADPDRIDGKVDDDYQTSAKEIEGYKLIEHTGNEKGKFEVEPLTITYYYLYKTKATVQYIDKITGQILEQSTTEGLEGDDFVTESKDFENYVLVEEPPEKTVKMTKEEQILKYYYIHVSGGVIEKHIDAISGQILANAVHNGNEGDAYDIPSKTFEGYDLVEDRLPANSKGTMKVEPVEVIYYYIYRSKVTSEYIDKNTGNKLTDDVVQKGHEGDNYTTERKTFDDYKLVEVPSNADGSMTKEDITVTYYYAHTSGGVIVNHIDIKTGKQLLDETKEEGYEGDPYETHEENIPEYDLVKEKYPENAVGKMTIEPTRVTYYYIKKTEVNVKYVDKETGEEIDVLSNIPGHEGDDYTTEPKDLPGYDLVEEPENKDGTMTADPIDVIYYYRRPAKVIVNYYDIDTKEKLADEIEIDGHQNDDYTTEQKDIKYYEIAKVPENKEGKMIVTVTKDENEKEIVDDTTYVNYYYRKLIFNLRVDKTIASVIVNGQETPINGNLGKVEVHRKNISTANVKVVYKIKVTNDSELTGKANVVENIPNGMTMKAENNPGWTINETTASIETDEIKPGESREYQVVLGWQNGDGNVGTKENIASIITENEAGFDEKDTTDNESKADLIVAVGTGEVPYVAIAGSILLIMISITSGIYVIRKRK